VEVLKLEFQETDWQEQVQAGSKSFSLTPEILAKLKAQVNQGSYKVKSSEVATKIIEQWQQQFKQWAETIEIKNKREKKM
jgi:anti-sigma28 factor (negative regulator of flagellin synthesis)